MVTCAGSKLIRKKDRAEKASPYCECWDKFIGQPWKDLGACSCGEEHRYNEWKWEKPLDEGHQWTVLSRDQKEVTFHPYYSSGTAGVRGDKPLVLNNHYYWEVKMLTDTYGTDIMVGVGTKQVNVMDNIFKFGSFLGQDQESYGLSYRGVVQHAGKITSKEIAGFCRGSIIGVRVDMWSGTLEFYLNRKPQGISFYNLRRHGELYPMTCSTAAQSAMRLVYAGSWRASLLVDAVKILAASTRAGQTQALPPGLRQTLHPFFWLTLPDNRDDSQLAETAVASASIRNASNASNLTKKMAESIFIFLYVATTYTSIKSFIQAWYQPEPRSGHLGNIVPVN